MEAKPASLNWSWCCRKVFGVLGSTARELILLLVTTIAHIDKETVLYNAFFAVLTQWFPGSIVLVKSFVFVLFSLLPTDFLVWSWFSLCCVQ
jgi:hypothetical protein